MQDKTKKTRALISFWVEPSIKERAEKFADHYGMLAHIARQSFIKEIERLENNAKAEKELKAS